MRDDGKAAGGGDAERSSIAMVAQLLDYAIVACAELRLPFLVYLLRMARLELPKDDDLHV
jgi:hypothetical protein